MPYPFGTVTKTKILKSESHKLFQEFEVGGVLCILTFAGDLVTSNTIDGEIDAVGIGQVTFSADHATTMALLVTELLGESTVLTATLIGTHTISFRAIDPAAAFALTNWVVAAGATQTTILAVTGTNFIYKGQPVQLETDGTVRPLVAGDYRYKSIGIAMHDGLDAELVTVMMKAFVIVFMESATDTLVAGPVKIHANGYNATTGYLEVDDASVTTANMLGWALDDGDDGDVIRVAIAP